MLSLTQWDSQAGSPFPLGRREIWFRGEMVEKDASRDANGI